MKVDGGLSPCQAEFSPETVQRFESGGVNTCGLIPPFRV